jgi:signal transduction histidine kinase
MRLHAPSLEVFAAKVRSRLQTDVARRWPSYAPIVLLAMLGALTTGILFGHVSKLEQQHADDAFADAARDRLWALRRETAYTVGSVKHVGSFFDASKDVSRNQFREFVAPIVTRYPGAQAFFWIPRIEASERGAFIEEARQSFPPFGIRPLDLIAPTQDPGERKTAGAVLYPILYVQPYQTNKTLLGADLGSSPETLNALTRASASGTPSVSSPIPIPISTRQSDEQQPEVGFAVFVPVYDAAVLQGSPWGDEIEAGDRPAGESEPRGFAGGLFRVQDLVDAALSNLRPSGIEIRLYFGELGADEPAPDVEPFYIHRSRAPESDEQSDPGSRLRTFSDEIRIGDQVWTMVGSPRPGYFESDLSSSHLILGSGIAFTLLACIYLSSLIGQARQVRRLVGQRTLELERSNAALNSEIADRERAEEALRQLNLTLEQRIEHRTAESERRARDLEQFAYVASHDLKAPLRGIANLATWLSQDLEDCLTPEVAEQLDLMRDRVARMNALIEGLLSYSRIGRDQGTDETIDIARLIADSVDSLAPPPGFKIQVAPNMPHLQGDPLALSMVLTNLIGNAIKHHDRTEGLVRICARCIGDRCEFNVKDDGPGIPPELHDKVFLMFQTLKVKDTQGDTGIGLAIVKKLVEEHGGHISLHSGPQRGCRFRFTWPRRPPKAEQAISEGSPVQGPEAR